MVFNYMETLVEQYLEEILKSNAKDRWILSDTSGILDDIKAKALNQLPPFYITGKKGEIFGQYYTKDIQKKTDILSAITQAVDFITKSTAQHP